MKTMNIFKTLALAMLMPSMLLTTACSSEDDFTNNTVNSQSVAKKGYALPVTVSATREGDKGSNRASYDDGTKKLSFSEGDKLFVRGEYGAYNKKFAGTLNYDATSKKFSGTLNAEDDTYSTYEDLFANATTYATLLPNGYENTGFLAIDDNSTPELYDDVESSDFTKAFVASETAKATGVEQLSFEMASTYSDGFTLTPLCAVLNFTISGLEAGAKAVALNVSSGFGDTVVEGSVTPNASGIATFAVGVISSARIKNMDNNLTVGSSNFTLPSSTTLTAGKIYNITRSAGPTYTLLSAVTTADYGKVVCAAGHLHDAKTAVPAGCTAVGILGKVPTTGHGLILALQDATSQSWYTIDSWASVTYAGTTLKQLPAGALGSLTSYTTLGSTTVSNWCVAQKSDYEAIFKNLGSAKYDEDGYTYDANVNAYITTGVGGTAISGTYWSATECDGWHGWYFLSNWWIAEGSMTQNFNLRPVLGF